MRNIERFNCENIFSGSSLILEGKGEGRGATKCGIWIKMDNVVMWKGGGNKEIKIKNNLQSRSIQFRVYYVLKRRILM